MSSEPDYMLQVTCRHETNVADAPERVIALIGHITPDDGPNVRRIGFLAWREYEHTPGYPDAMQTYYGEVRRLGLLGPGRPNRAPAELIPNMTEGIRWRFWCEDCEDTYPVRHSRVEPFLERLRHANVPSVDLSSLRKYA